MTVRRKNAYWLAWLSACTITPAEDSAPVSAEGFGQELAAPEGTCEAVSFGTDCGSDGRLYVCFGNQAAGEGQDCPNGCMDTGGDSDACVEPEPCSDQPEVCDNADNDCDGSVDEDVHNVCGGNCGSLPDKAVGMTCVLSGENDCYVIGILRCNGREDLFCDPRCWYLCVRGESAAVRTQDPCAWAVGGGDVACVPEDPSCPLNAE